MAIIRVLPHSLTMLSGPFQSWASLTNSLSSNHSETWIRLAPTSLAPLLPLLLHQHLPDRVLRHPTSPSPLHPLLPPLTLPSTSATGHPIRKLCTTTGLVEAKFFLKQRLLHHIDPPSSPTASPASISSQSPSDTPQSTSAASASDLSSSSFQHDSHTSWNADTGASAHMTCHLHWMQNLKPHRIQIRLADGSVVFSEGVGSVRFNPVVNGQEMAPLEFTNVLYVPALCSNLFSVFYLTLHCHFTVCIEQDTTHLIRDNKIAFQASRWCPLVRSSHSRQSQV